MRARRGAAAAVTRVVCGASITALLIAVGVARTNAEPVVVGAKPPRPDGRVVYEAGLHPHGRFERLLREYVGADGFVRYADWKRDGLDDLDDYLGDMARVAPDSIGGRLDSLAFWINVYNALTIRAVLKYYPIQSIKEKTGTLGLGFNVWDDFRVALRGREYSLNQIEHERLRKMSEPRIHMAIVCASIGCPKLLWRAYRADRLEAQLIGNTRDFFARPDRLTIDRAARVVRVSPILEWFGDDFGGTDAAKLAFIARYAPTPTDSAFLVSGGLRLEYLDYDWRLNDVSNAAR